MYIHTHLDPEQILQAALRDGSILHKEDVFLMHGPGGVGKSSIIDMFLGRARDLARNSTPVAMEPLLLQPIREVSTSLFTADWQVVNYERLSCMVAYTSNELHLKKLNEKREEQTEEAKKEEDMGEGREEKRKGDEEESGEGGKDGDPTASGVEAMAASPKPDPKRDICMIASHFFAKLGKVFRRSSKSKQKQEDDPATSDDDALRFDDSADKDDDALPSITEMLENDPDNIANIVSDFLDSLHDKVRNPSEVGELLLSHSIRLTDSGGQPQFHDLVSIFLSHITGFISVFKLSERLSDHGEVVFYNVGELINEPYESHYSHEQVIRHDLQAIQSEAACSDMEEMPNLAFVGTFLDEKDNCSETPEQKDERLHSIITEMLPPEMQHCVITDGGSLKRATFKINARTPGERDFKTVGRLKGALMSQSRSKPSKLPLNWHGYEIALHMLMKELRRQSLRRKECEFIGHKLGFDLASLSAALNYLRKLNIIFFSDVLPDVIFGSSQVILDKITELVRYSLELTKGSRGVSGADRKFMHQGIITLEFLKSPALSRHYIQDLFEPEDLLKVFISLLVVSEIGKKEYIVPCVLGVSSIYPSPPPPEGSMRSSFILHFSKKSPMFGIYCCTVSSLISDAGWNLLTEDGEVVQVARNSITFEVPNGLPGMLTFLDPLSSYLEVVLELPVHVAAEHSMTLYPEILNAFITAVKKSMEMLHYDVRAPEVSFMCPDQSSRCSESPHPATLDDKQSCLKCSLKPGTVSHPLSEDQKMWLTSGAGMFTHIINKRA